MSVPFDPQQGLTIVRAELWGHNGGGVLRLALDGATGTVVNVGMPVTQEPHRSSTVGTVLCPRGQPP